MDDRRSAGTAKAKMVGQTAAAGIQIGVRRTLPISPERAWAFLVSPEGLTLWLGRMQKPLQWTAGEEFNSEEGISGKLVVVKPGRQLRLRWKPKDWERPSTLQIRFLSDQPDKATISFHQEQLASFEMREQMKRKWEDALETIRIRA